MVEDILCCGAEWLHMCLFGRTPSLPLTNSWFLIRIIKSQSQSWKCVTNVSKLFLLPFTGIYLKVLPFIIFGAISFAAAAVNMLLPDTRNSKLPDLISETKPIRRYVAVKNNNCVHHEGFLLCMYKECSSLCDHSCCFHKETPIQQNVVQEKVWRDEPREPAENNFGILAKLQQWKCNLFTFTWLEAKAVWQFTVKLLLLFFLLSFKM